MVRMTKAGKLDLNEWRKLGESGRTFIEEETRWVVHTDSAELSLSRAGRSDEEHSAESFSKAESLWDATGRKQSITLRALRTVDLLPDRGLGVDVYNTDVKRGKLDIDNQGAKFVIQKIGSNSPALMTELRVLHNLTNKLGIDLVRKWIPSASNYFADQENGS